MSLHFLKFINQHDVSRGHISVNRWPHYLKWLSTYVLVALFEIRNRRIMVVEKAIWIESNAIGCGQIRIKHNRMRPNLLQQREKPFESTKTQSEAAKSESKQEEKPCESTKHNRMRPIRCSSRKSHLNQLKRDRMQPNLLQQQEKPFESTKTRSDAAKSVTAAGKALWID